jgi:hypothetical protein
MAHVLKRIEKDFLSSAHTDQADRPSLPRRRPAGQLTLLSDRDYTGSDALRSFHVPPVVVQAGGSRSNHPSPALSADNNR